MRSIRTIFYISFQNIRKWKTDYRVWMLAILILLITHGQISEISRAAAYIGTAQTPWIYPFLYAQFYMKLIYTLPLLLLFCDAPFLDNNQGFLISRTGRTKWCFGQLLYIVLTSALYYLFIIFLTILFPLFQMDWTADWGAILQTLSRTNVMGELEITTFTINQNVLAYFTPFQAMWFTFLVSWLSGVFLGFLVYACNICLQKKIFGGMVGGFLILLSAFLSNENPTGKGASYFSPMSWNTLNQIDIANMTNSPSFSYVMTFYLAGSALLIGIILLVNRKMEVTQNGDDRK